MNCDWLDFDGLLWFLWSTSVEDHFAPKIRRVEVPSIIELVWLRKWSRSIVALTDRCGIVFCPLLKCVSAAALCERIGSKKIYYLQLLNKLIRVWHSKVFWGVHLSMVYAAERKSSARSHIDTAKRTGSFWTKDTYILLIHIQGSPWCDWELRTGGIARVVPQYKSKQQ